MLAQLLLASPDVMLLDEPSNHLDIDTTRWLEDYLVRQPEAMIVVSPDRYFLDRVVTKIFEMTRQRITVCAVRRHWRAVTGRGAPSLGAAPSRRAVTRGVPRRWRWGRC